MEGTAFHQEYSTLLIGIRTGVHTLAIEACSDDLVCEEVKNKATSPTTDKDTRTRAFLDGVQDRIKTDPGAFYKFVDLLREQPAYEHLAKKLVAKKGELNSHPKSVAESQSQRQDTAATDRGLPNRRFSGHLIYPSATETGPRSISGRRETPTSTAAGPRHFTSRPETPTGPRPISGRRETPTGPRPISGHPEAPTGPRSISGCRETPTAAGPRPVSGRPETPTGPRPISSRRETPTAAGPRPISSHQETPPGPRPISGPGRNQKTDSHPLELNPSSVRPEGDSGHIGSPDSFFSDGEDSEDFSSESTEITGNEIAVHTTAPTPVSEEQSISGPCKWSGIVSLQEQGNMGTPVANPQSHGGSKLTVTMPQRSDSTESNEFMTPPTSPQPGPIQESSTEGASTTALAGGDYSQPTMYHHRQRITELEEKLSKSMALLQERERELRVSEETKRQLLRKEKQRKENKRFLRELQSKLETAERKIWDLQAELESAYQTIDDQRREIGEMKTQLDLSDTKAFAFDEIRKKAALERRLEEVQMRLDQVELQHDCMTQPY